MAFTLETWKEQVAERLWNWRLRLERAKPKAVYTALSAMSLWPLVQAAQGDGFASTLMALASVAQGVGGNLIAEQIQRWRDEADTLSPDAVETWVQTHLADNAEVRDALHTIVEKVEAIEQAQAGLSEPERQWFIETLRSELTQVGAASRFEAHLWGSNNVLNQGDIQIPGNVGGDVFGPGSSKTTHYHYAAVPREEPSPPGAWQAYLSWVISRVHAVPLAGIDPHSTPDQQRPELELTAVYTALMTDRAEPDAASPLERGHRRLSALAVLNKEQRVALLGDPGSGKSTFVNFVALCMAGELLGHAEANLQVLCAPVPREDRQRDEAPQPQRWDRGPLLPVHVVLRDFVARGLPRQDAPAAVTLLE